MLLVGAGLFLRDFQQLLAVDPGFGRAPAALLSLVVPDSEATADQGRQYLRRLLDRFGALPGVEAVGFTGNLPMAGLDMSIDFNVDGYSAPLGQDAFRSDVAPIDPGFFDAAGVPIVAGRRFRDADGIDAPRVAIISETMARQFWPDGDAIGGIVRRVDGDDMELRVVGVVGDVAAQPLSERRALMVYLPYTQYLTRVPTFIARTSVDPEQTALAMETAGRALDPNLRGIQLVKLNTRTVAQLLAIPRLPAQLGALVLSMFAVLALGLAVIGLYGVVSYSVAARTREVAIRLALGANAPAITRLLVTAAVRLVLVGTGIGLTLALGVSRVLTGLLVGTRTSDPVALVAAPLALGATALLAAYLPARRASRANPVTALRAE